MFWTVTVNGETISYGMTLSEAIGAMQLFPAALVSIEPDTEERCATPFDLKG